MNNNISLEELANEVKEMALDLIVNNLKKGVEATEFKLDCHLCNRSLRDTSVENLLEKAQEKYHWRFQRFPSEDRIWVCRSCNLKVLNEFGD